MSYYSSKSDALVWLIVNRGEVANPQNVLRLIYENHVAQSDSCYRPGWLVRYNVFFEGEGESVVSLKRKEESRNVVRRCRVCRVDELCYVPLSIGRQPVPYKSSINDWDRGYW